jgi:hypothetical protein
LELPTRSSLSRAELLKLPAVERTRPARQRLIEKTTAFALCMAGAVVAAAACLAVLVATEIGTSIVPDVSGLSLSAARQKLEAEGLTGQLSGERYASQQRDTVLSQEPAGGVRLRRAGAVRLIVSKGVRGFVLPDVSGRQSAAARRELENLGLTVSVLEESAETTAGTVLFTVPSAGTRASAGDALVLHVAAAKSDVLLRSWPLSGKRVVIEPQYVSGYGAFDLSYEIARRLDSLLRAAGAGVVVSRNAQERAVSGRTYEDRAHTARPQAFVRLRASNDAGQAGLLIRARTKLSDSLGQAAFDELHSVFPEVGVADSSVESVIEQSRSVELSLGSTKSKEDRALFADSRWCDTVARALYMAIGGTLSEQSVNQTK